MSEKDKDVLLVAVLIVFSVCVALIVFYPEKTCEEKGGEVIQTGYTFQHNKGDMKLTPIYECVMP